MFSEPPVATPEIEKALQLKHTMDEMTGQLPPSRRILGHKAFLNVFLVAVGILTFLVLFAQWPAFLLLVLVIFGGLVWFNTGSSTNSFSSPKKFILTRTSLACDGVAYAWTRIRECAFDRTDSFLTLTLKDGQKLQWGPFSTKHHDSLQWFCELINHRAGLAGDETEIPEDIKAIRRQKDSV